MLPAQSNVLRRAPSTLAAFSSYVSPARRDATSHAANRGAQSRTPRVPSEDGWVLVRGVHRGEVGGRYLPAGLVLRVWNLPRPVPEGDRSSCRNRMIVPVSFPGRACHPLTV